MDIGALDPFLRGLLFTDGTVTRALEVHTLSRVDLEVVDQAAAVGPDEVTQHLQLAAGAECLRRRVIMSLAGAPVVWAESYIVTDRLPEGFMGLLSESAHGIGDSLQQIKLESWRELLWFELGRSPRWASKPTRTTLVRLYRVITDGRPALLITEAFAVESHSGTYRIPGSPGVAYGAAADAHGLGRVGAGD